MKVKILLFALLLSFVACEEDEKINSCEVWQYGDIRVKNTKPDTIRVGVNGLIQRQLLPGESSDIAFLKPGEIKITFLTTKNQVRDSAIVQLVACAKEEVSF